MMRLVGEAHLSALALRVVQTHGLPTTAASFLRWKSRRGRFVLGSSRERCREIESMHWRERTNLGRESNGKERVQIARAKRRNAGEISFGKGIRHCCVPTRSLGE